MDINVKYHKFKDTYTIKKAKIEGWINTKQDTKRSNDIVDVVQRTTEKKHKMLIRNNEI